MRAFAIPGCKAAVCAQAPSKTLRFQQAKHVNASFGERRCMLTPGFPQTRSITSPTSRRHATIADDAGASSPAVLPTDIPGVADVIDLDDEEVVYPPADYPSADAPEGDDVSTNADAVAEVAGPSAADAEDAVIETVLHTAAPLEEESVTELLLQDIPPSHHLQSALNWFQYSTPGRALSVTTAVLLGATFAMAALRTVQKVTSKKAKRKRQIDRNRLVIDELGKYFPGNAASLTSSVCKNLQGKTGFTATELFRKYLSYLLKERTFDQEAVDDLVQLRVCLQLMPEAVAEALQERAQRTYDQFGSLMLNTAGMTAEGAVRKAACTSLFQKLLYLVEHEPLGAHQEAVPLVDLREIFGATDEDIQRLRLVSLVDVDWSVMEQLATDNNDPNEKKP